MQLINSKLSLIQKNTDENINEAKRTKLELEFNRLLFDAINKLDMSIPQIRHCFENSVEEVKSSYLESELIAFGILS